MQEPMKPEAVDGYTSDPTSMSSSNLDYGNVEPIKPKNKFVRGYDKVAQGWLGFNKSYNLPLFIIFGGAMLGFVLARFQYLNFDGIFLKTGLPGDSYIYRGGNYRIGLIIHLACILPAGFLAVFQFVPIIRKKLLLLHRINGYLVTLLLLASNGSAFMITRHAAGGAIETNLAIGIIGIATTVSALLGYINIKRYQIEQHRAWMLRTWFYAGAIISLRLILFMASAIVSLVGSFNFIWTCEKISWVSGLPSTRRRYPACFDAGGALLAQRPAIVRADLLNPQGGDEAGAALNLTFGSAGMLALALHAIGVEIYLALTTKEAERLRVLSYRKQVAAGMRKPGSAGITTDRLGDVKAWEPPAEVVKEFEGRV